VSSLAADLGIWALLFTGIVFSGLGLMGLLIFPDTKSRMFTAFRATAIGLGAVFLAVMLYGFFMLTSIGGDEYPALILRTLVLVLVLGAGTWGMNTVIRKRLQNQKPDRSCQPPSGPGAEEQK
jgi:multisubunit Na+/H+ antiporter MnhG subunit